MRVVIVDPVPTIHTQQEPDREKGQPPEKPVLRFLNPEWVIVYITAGYTVVALFQWLTIKRQADLLAKQIRDAKESSDAAANTASGTLAAIQGQLTEMEVANQHAGTQAEALKRQTDLMGEQIAALKQSATAAMLNAQALIASERPWFVPSIERPSPQYYWWRTMITNRGRTPGQLMELSVDHIFVGSPENLPIPPRYGLVGYLPHTRFLANGDGFAAREWSGTDLDHPFWGCFSPRDIWQGNPSQINFLVVYGKATYTDTITTNSGVIHETRWCYLYRPTSEDFIACGSSHYNGYRDYDAGEEKAS